MNFLSNLDYQYEIMNSLWRNDVNNNRPFLVQIGRFTLIQQNGQRTYGGPPPNWGARPPPNRECEVFIGRLPRLVFEDELIPLFSEVGELYEFRLMLDFSGTNRGYGYAHYATLQGAANAIKHLNKFEIRPNHQIGVLKSKNNCRLLFGNINPRFTKDSFESFIRSATENVLEVVMFANYNELKKITLNISNEVEEAILSRVTKGSTGSQFAIVEYENHKAAAVARRVLVPSFYGQHFSIDWAVPPKERKRNMMYENGDALVHSNNARPIQGIKNEAKALQPQAGIKPRPVPGLQIGASIFDRIAIIPPNIQGVVNYFKFLIEEAISSSANRQEIPIQIYEEIKTKIIHRITNLENCGQAVQLILNYFAWYNEKKASILNPEAHKILQEVKLYSDLFVRHIFMKLNNEMIIPERDEYYTTVLPTELNLIYRYALTATGSEKEKFCGCISESLDWLRRFAKLYTAVKNGASNNTFVNQNQSKEFIPQYNNGLRPLNAFQNVNMERQFEYNNNKIGNTNDSSAFCWNNVYSELRKIDDQKENVPNWEVNWNQSRGQIFTNYSKPSSAQGREMPMTCGFYGQNALDQMNGNISGRDVCVEENVSAPMEYSHFNSWDWKGVQSIFPRINCPQTTNFNSTPMSFSPDSGISTDLEQNFLPISRNGMEQAVTTREK